MEGDLVRASHIAPNPIMFYDKYGGPRSEETTTILLALAVGKMLCSNSNSEMIGE